MTMAIINTVINKNIKIMKVYLILVKITRIKFVYTAILTLKLKVTANNQNRISTNKSNKKWLINRLKHNNS